MASVPVDTTRFGDLRVESVQSKTDSTGAQRRDRRTGLPLWVVRVLRRPAAGRSDFVNITVPASVEPDLPQDAAVIARNLIASDYHLDNGRSGLSFRADSIDVLDEVVR